MKYFLVLPILLACLWLCNDARADGFTIKPDDSVQKILGDWKGKRVTLRLSDGTEITGKVRKVTTEVVEMGMSDHGFYSKTVEIGKIAMLIVKPKDY
ncbi:MAG TPA: hypothetical protein PLI53_08105 [Geobacteraceae bacterium]|nr:hypothetical protein [Geobacteraceae bacterium]